jgi:hypothetical protein
MQEEHGKEQPTGKETSSQDETYISLYHPHLDHARTPSQ